MIQSELISDEVAFRSLASEWIDLYRVSGHTSPFMSWEWASTWWDHFGSGRLHILALRREDRLSGLAPLYRDIGPYGVPTLRLIGAGQSDYLDFLVRPDETGADYEDLVQAVLSSGGSDLIWLEQVPPDRLEILRKESRSAGSYLQVKERGHCYSAGLPSRWEDYLAGLGGNERYNIGRRTRALEKQHGIAFRRLHQPGGELDRKIEDLFGLMIRRLAMRGRDLDVNHEASLKFHKEIAQRFAHRGWLNLGVLESGGRTIAGLMAFEYDRKLFYYHSGFDPAWSKYSVGMVLLAKCIEDGIGRGIREFDFMRGRGAYKMKWKVDERSFYRVVITRSMAGYLKFLGQSLTSRLQKNIHRLTTGRGGNRDRSEKGDPVRNDPGS